MIVYKCDTCKEEIKDVNFDGELHKIPTGKEWGPITISTPGDTCLKCIHDAVGKELE